MSENNVQSYFIPLSIIIAGALIAGGIYFSGGIAAPSGTNTGGQQAGKLPTVKKIDTTRDHFRGNANAKVVIVEYSDLQCPYCQLFQGVMQQVINKYGASGQVAWVFRHFPLSSIHPEARPAALAAECVAKNKGEDAFWRFTDAAFADQGNIGDALLKKLALAEGISASDLDKCVADPAIAKRVADDEKEIMSQGVQGTPFSVVFKDGKVIGVINGAQKYPDVETAIEQAINPTKTPEVTN
jgi:protein-disulfide isomerase